MDSLIERQKEFRTCAALPPNSPGTPEHFGVPSSCPGGLFPSVDQCNGFPGAITNFLIIPFVKVTKEEGLALAREFSCPFFETSAAYRYYIDDVFHALVREIRRKEKEAVLAMEKKSKPKTSVWKRLKSPFRKKKDSVT